jgi:hypothetical protein
MKLNYLILLSEDRNNKLEDREMENIMTEEQKKRKSEQKLTNL